MNIGKSGYPSRRQILRLGVVGAGLATALPLLQACGGGAATPTTAPAAPPAQPTAAPTKAAAPSAAPTTAQAAPTTAPAAAPAAPTTTAAATAPPTPAAAGLPAYSMSVDPSSVKINGSFKVVQQSDWNPIHNAYLEKFVKDTATTYGWKLDHSYEAGFTGGTPFYEKIAAAVSSGTGPDLLWGDYDTMTMHYLKTVQPVDDIVNSMIKRFGKPSPGYEPYTKLEGKWYGVPYFTRTGGWWARKSVYAAKGIDVLKLEDFDQWKQASLEVSDPKQRMWAYGPFVSRSGDGETNVSTYWFQTGNRLTDETGRKVLFNTEGSIAAFEWMKDLYLNPKYQKMLQPGQMGWNDMSDNYAWFAGTIAFNSNAGTIPAQAIKSFPEIAKDTYMVPQPKMPIGAKQTLVGSAGGAKFYLMEGAKNPDAAKSLMEIMLAPDQQMKLWDFTSTYVTPAYEWGWDSDPVKNSLNNIDLIFKEYAFAPNAFAWYQPAPNPLLWVNGVSNAVVFTDTMAAIVKGTSVKDAVAQGQARCEAIGKQFDWK